MARIRTIKPEFWTDSKIVRLPFEARLLFIGLWNFADDEGWLKYDPLQLKLQILPADNVDCEKLLSTLAESGLICIRQAGDFVAMQIVNFTTHQRVNRPAPSEIAPRFSEESGSTHGTFSEGSVNVHGTLSEDSRWKGKEGKGKEGNTSPDGEVCAELQQAVASAPNATPAEAPKEKSEWDFPVTGKGGSTWNLSRSKLGEYREAFPHLDVEGELRKARQWCRDNPSKQKTAGGCSSSSPTGSIALRTTAAARVLDLMRTHEADQGRSIKSNRENTLVTSDNELTPEEQRELAEKRLRWGNLIRKLGMRYARCTIESFDFHGEPDEQSRQRAVVDSLKIFGREIRQRTELGQGLLFYGPPGTGKDHLMVSMLRCAVKAGLEVAWENGATVFRERRDYISQQFLEKDLVSYYVHPDILALSDPLPISAPLSASQADYLLGIVDERYRHLKPTWVTANVASSAEAGSRFGEQLFDRLKDGALPLFCNWPSYRNTIRGLTND